MAIEFTDNEKIIELLLQHPSVDCNELSGKDTIYSIFYK